MHTLLVFEFLGTTELLVIAVVALILFGPRKLPEIGRSVGKSLAEFKRASDEFKRTWEYEVELERRNPAPAAEVAPAPATYDLPHDPAASLPDAHAAEPTVARGASEPHEPAGADAALTNHAARDVATGSAHDEEDEVNAS